MNYIKNKGNKVSSFLITLPHFITTLEVIKYLHGENTIV